MQKTVLTNPFRLPDTARPATRAVHDGVERSQFGELSEAMYLTSSFTYDRIEDAVARFAGDAPGFMYTRTGNPTITMFEMRLAAIEGAPAARATASGMAAVNAALLALLKTGDHVITGQQLFGSCRWLLGQLLPKLGIDVTFVDMTDLEAWRAAIRPETRMFFVEPLANPTLELADLAALSALAKDAGALLVADNALSSPAVQRPFAFGADVVTYSATKHIDGHGRTIGGMILSEEALMEETIAPYLRHSGGCLSPFNAWVLIKGLESLDLRVERQSKNAARIADTLAASNKAGRVLHPSRPDYPYAEIARRQLTLPGSVLGVDLGSQEAAFRFANALRIVRISNNFGDAKSIVTHPATTTHQTVPVEEQLALGITPGFLRLSAGLEDGDDLAEDVAQALAAI